MKIGRPARGSGLSAAVVEAHGILVEQPPAVVPVDRVDL